MEMTKEEKQALLDEFLESTKAALALEAKADIEKVQKLIADERKKYEDSLKGLITKAELETYEEKSRAAEKKHQDKVDLLETKMNRIPIENPEQNAVVEGGPEYKASFFNFMRNGKLDLTDEKASKCWQDRWELTHPEVKALVSDATGQILLPEEVEAEIYRSLPKINIIRQLATIRTTVRERVRRRSMDEVTMGWGKLELGGEPPEADLSPAEAFQYVEDLEGLARIGKDELADTDVSLEAIILDSFRRAKAETEETGFVVGTGHDNRQPEGILNGTVVTRVKTAAHDAIAANDLLDLIYAVPAQYRRNGKILVPSTTELAMRKLTSGSDDLYLWQPQMAAGKPPTFAGYPVYAQEDIPAIASAAECDIAIFGDIKAGYRIIDRMGMTVQRLIEKFITAGLIGILVSSRATGGVIRADALRVLQEKAGG